MQDRYPYSDLGKRFFVYVTEVFENVYLTVENAIADQVAFGPGTQFRIRVVEKLLLPQQQQQQQQQWQWRGVPNGEQNEAE